jgi:hypothetical protein
MLMHKKSRCVPKSREEDAGKAVKGVQGNPAGGGWGGGREKG